MSHMQFLCGSRHAELAGGCVKGAKRIERGKSAHEVETSI
ncbi:hypothetical protein K788_0007016 (plasmid) [Paraburkholderia caribensis MBA4]|uniref:Uncharacterized protein n=1 Tax=Paraburkholderia caribensis MBA4 TaxID=1323664 RepID=A0A0N7JW32_9BURK|nr:hypothetical protein K788_0007016 [Paraburkholderia caribensis MBA4]